MLKYFSPQLTAMVQGRWRLALQGALIAVLLLGMVEFLLQMGGKTFYIELAGFAVLVLLSLLGFIGSGARWAEVLLFVVFLFFIVNVVLIWFVLGTLYLVLLLIALVGFFLSLPRPASREKRKAEQQSMVFDEKKAMDTQKKVTTTYTPGKYMASKTSNVYHEPVCEWAKKIQRSRQVWLADKKEAYEKGYKKHSCVQ